MLLILFSWPASKSVVLYCAVQQVVVFITQYNHRDNLGIENGSLQIIYIFVHILSYGKSQTSFTIINSFPMNSVRWISHCVTHITLTVWVNHSLCPVPSIHLNKTQFTGTASFWPLFFMIFASFQSNKCHTLTCARAHTHNKPVHSLYSCLLNLLSKAFDLRPWLSLRDWRRLLVGNKLHLGSVIHHLSMTEPRLEMGSLLLFLWVSLSLGRMPSPCEL